MSGSRTFGLAVAVAAGIGVAACDRFTGGGSGRGRDKDTSVTLSGTPCQVTSKEAEFHVGKGKKVTWRITNNCEAAQVVAIGNFRTADFTTVANCNAAMLEPTWPFRDKDQSVKIVYIPGGASDDIELREAKNDTGADRTLFFDVCVNGKKSDPKMIVDP